MYLWRTEGWCAISIVPSPSIPFPSPLPTPLPRRLDAAPSSSSPPRRPDAALSSPDAAAPPPRRPRLLGAALPVAPPRWTPSPRRPRRRRPGRRPVHTTVAGAPPPPGPRPRHPPHAPLPGILILSDRLLHPGPLLQGKLPPRCAISSVCAVEQPPARFLPYLLQIVPQQFCIREVKGS